MSFARNGNGNVWSGLCPDCNCEMRMNKEYNYECNQCGLQVEIGKITRILKERGEGNFIVNTAGQYHTRKSIYDLTIDEDQRGGTERQIEL